MKKLASTLIAFAASVGVAKAAENSAGLPAPSPSASPTPAVKSAAAELPGAPAPTTNPEISLTGGGTPSGDPSKATNVSPAATTFNAVGAKWTASIYGFVESDSIFDSTQSFTDVAGNGLVSRPGTLQNDGMGRLTFGVRNSRIGFKMATPAEELTRASAVLEMDFLGNQPPGVSESAFFTNPTFRIRHFYLRYENPVADILVGQTWELFGFQPYFHPNSVEIQGLPGQVYSRSPQVRVSKMLKTDALNVELALAASRPPQRDSGAPDGQAGVRFLLNNWKGARTAGATGSSLDSLALGISGVYRQITIPQFSASPTGTNTVDGSGISLDALIPILPGSEATRANSLTLTGSWVNGTGISDLYTGLTGGVSYPALPGTPTPPAFTPDVDNGLVTYDSSGVLHAVDWQSTLVGLQYYLPGSGKLWVAFNASQMVSDNSATYVSGAALSKVTKQMNWGDANLFWDVSSALRMGAEYAAFDQTYGDGTHARNNRFQFSAYYMF